MYVHVFEFETEKEAQAFVKGVEFVNDSALGEKVIFSSENDENWTVEVSDYEEGSEEESREDQEIESATE